MSVRALSIGLIGITILLMSIHFLEYLRYSIAAVYYRFEIFDAEGIVWQQAMMIPGPHMYGDITKYPFIVFHYPPVYHMLSRLLSGLGSTPLFAGRALSLASALASGAAISALTYRLTRLEDGGVAAGLGGALSGLVFFCFFPVILTSTVMRVDMLAIFFSYAGFLCFTARIRSWAPFVGMAFFVLGVFTKQTALSAPLAALAVTGLIEPRRGLKLLGFGILLGAVPLAILMAMTQGAFLRHLVLYNINRYYPFLIGSELSGQAPHILFVLIALAAPILWWRNFLATAALGALNGWREALARDDAARTMAMLTIYLCLTTLMLAGLGKNGAGISYFDEWVGLLSVLIGVFVAKIAAPLAAGGFQVHPFVKIMLPVLLIVQVAILPAKGRMNFSDEAEARQSDELVKMIAGAEKPVLSADMVMLMIAGKQVPWEPAIFAELASLGRWDESQITRMIAGHEFAFIVTRSTTTFTPAVAAAVAAAYPRTQEIAHHIVHFAPA